MVSILMANYNNGQFIEEAIQSVLNQTYRNWELIIVDDFSSDNSIEILTKVIKIDERIKVFFNSQNKGCGFTKRKAAKLSAGNYLIFLDSDDALTPDAINELLNIHRSNANCSIAYATHFICDKHLNVLHISNYAGQVPLGDTNTSIRGKKISLPALFTKSNYIKTEGINSSFKRAVDSDLYSKLEELGTVIFLDKPLCYYRQHDSNISLFENNIKAQYWNMIVAEHTYKRRKINPSSFVRNLTSQEIRSIKFYYHKRKFHQALSQKKYGQLFFYFLKCFALLNRQTFKPFLGSIKFSLSKFF